MDQLIGITTNERGTQIVSARELYNFLEVSEKFADWGKRMLEFDFVENVDFFRIIGKSTGGRPSTDFVLTIDAAKQIAMLQRSDKGRQARQYFLACERSLQQAHSLSFPNFHNPAAAARAWADQYEGKQLAETMINELQPKADFAEAVMQSEDTVSVGDMARILAYRGLGQNNLFEFLRANGILLSNGSNRPYQKYIDQGWCRVVEVKWQHPKEGQKVGLKTVFTQKGIFNVRQIIEKLGYVPLAQTRDSQNKQTYDLSHH